MDPIFKTAVHSNVICTHDNRVSCGSCRLNTICIPVSLHIDDIDKLNQIIQRGRPLQKGQTLFRANDLFTSVYAVRSGAVKSTTLSDNGDEQVTGFYLPGEVVGMDGLADNRHTNSVVALETSSVCEIPFHRLEELSIKLPNLQRHFLQLMSREITHEQQIISLLSKSSAEARIASFLLSISTRNSNRKLSAKAFLLPMSRTDLGNFLGLTIETVSRTFSKLQKNQILDVNKKEIVILDVDALKQLAKGES